MLGRSGEVEATQVVLKTVWAVAERGPRSYLTRVGVAWEAADGSLCVRLDAIPISGQLRIRDWTPRPVDAAVPARAACEEHER
jgi:hypothetical protein